MLRGLKGLPISRLEEYPLTMENLFLRFKLLVVVIPLACQYIEIVRIQIRLITQQMMVGKGRHGMGCQKKC
ncbi:hypothetical protein TK34_00550 [Aeromonas hydrophila]|nr:hypothetical protein TK34_00550 [Aeromonas hydrophila]